MDHKKLWKILQEMGIPDGLMCLLRNLHAGQETAVTTGHGTTYWFQIGKEVRQDYILSPCLFNVYAEFILPNTKLDEAQAGINIVRRNISKLRYINDTTLMAEIEELKSLSMKVPTKIHLVKAMGFRVGIYGCESWTIKKAEHQRIGAFELWC